MSEFYFSLEETIKGPGICQGCQLLVEIMI